MVHKPFMGRSSVEESGAGFYGRMAERINGTNSNINWTHSIFQVDSSNFGELSTSKVQESKDQFLSFGGQETLSTHTRLDQVKPRAQELMPNSNVLANPLEFKKALKREASDNIDLDLDLSLKLNSRVTLVNQGSMEEHEVDSNLSLSLHSQSSSSYHSSRFKEAQDHCKEKGKRASALDLTI